MFSLCFQNFVKYLFIFFQKRNGKDKEQQTFKVLQIKTKNNWENNLFAAIKSYDTPTNIFICSNNEYEHHKRLL